MERRNSTVLARSRHRAGTPVDTGRAVRGVSALTVIVLLLTGCSAFVGQRGAEKDCGPFDGYGKHPGSTVSVYSSVRGVESDRLTRAWETFERCTGVDIAHEGSAEFESALEERVRAGSAPDLALFPQPGLIARMARAGTLRPVSPQVRANVEKWWAPEWRSYGTVDGHLYAAPFDGSVKSFVWYSPALFRERGYAVPTTWAELRTLTERIAADGVTPWCAGIESGAATGWPVTDWLEDVLLRTEGPHVYDQWVAHDIRFDDPRVVAALDLVGTILRNPHYVNGGHGDVRSIAATSFQEGGLPVLERKCALHRQASFYVSQWPGSARVAEDGDVYAFYLPPIDPAKGRPVLGAGLFAGLIADRPEVRTVAAYLSTPEFANSRARASGDTSANRGLDPANLDAPVSKLAAGLLADPGVTFRFDGSDLMPAAVGAGTFWQGMTEWVNGADTAAVLGRIETSWPAR